VSDRRPAYVAAAANGVVAGLAPVFAAALTVSATTSAAWRMLIGTVWLLPTLRHWRAIPWKASFLSSLTYVTGLPAYFLAAQLTSVASMLVFSATLPAWVALGERVFFGTRLPRPVLLAMVVVMGGAVVAVLGESASGTTPWGIAVAFFAMVVVFVVYILITQHTMQHHQVGPYIFGVSLFATAMLSPWAITGVGELSWRDFGVLIAMALTGGVAGAWMGAWAQKRLSGAVTSTLQLISVPSGALIAFIALDQQPNPFIVIGGAIVIAGTITLVRAEQRSRPDLVAVVDPAIDPTAAETILDEFDVDESD